MPADDVPNHGHETELSAKRGSAELNRMRGRATDLVDDLEGLHWDNCKVIFDRYMAFRFIWKALREGHDGARIFACYERALFECHALATDRTASRGQVCKFELSSTVSRASKHLAHDGLTTVERVHKWYRSQRSRCHWCR
jgi:hypothetical protein